MVVVSLGNRVGCLIEKKTVHTNEPALFLPKRNRMKNGRRFARLFSVHENIPIRESLLVISFESEPNCVPSPLTTKKRDMKEGFDGSGTLLGGGADRRKLGIGETAEKMAARRRSARAEGWSRRAVSTGVWNIF